MKPNEITTIKDEVVVLLEKDSRLRDSDSKLWARVIANQIEPKSISAYDLLCLIALDKLPSYESVSRARRKIQEERPDLRGQLRLQRIIAEENVRTELGYPSSNH